MFFSGEVVHSFQYTLGGFNFFQQWKTTVLIWGHLLDSALSWPSTEGLCTMDLIGKSGHTSLPLLWMHRRPDLQCGCREPEIWRKNAELIFALQISATFKIGHIYKCHWKCHQRTESIVKVSGKFSVPSKSSLMTNFYLFSQMLYFYKYCETKFQCHLFRIIFFNTVKMAKQTFSFSVP